MRHGESPQTCAGVVTHRGLPVTPHGFFGFSDRCRSRGRPLAFSAAGFGPVYRISNPAALLGNFHAGAADVYVGDARIVVLQLLDEKDRVIACAASRHERAKTIAKTLSPTEAVVIQLAQTVLIRDHQSFGFVAGIPQGERIVLVLRAHAGRVVGWCIVVLAHERR